MKRLIAYILVLMTVLSLMPAQAASMRIFCMLEGEEKDFSEHFAGYEVSFESSDPQVATMDNDAVVHALNAGTTVLTAKRGKKAARCGLIVYPAAISLNAGSTYELPGGSHVRYAVQDKAVAKVSKSGVIGAIAEGETVLAIKSGSQTVTISIEVSDVDVEQSRAAELACAATAQQIVLVEYTGGSSAEISLHEKKDNVWTELYSGQACVGKNGIGKTKEGDGKTPTGTFNLTTPFGIESDPGAAQAYTKVNKYHYWCGASGSEYYNKLVDSRTTSWKKSSADEHLIDYKGNYDYAMFIDYNAAGEAGKGSCIFLHCTGKSKSTAGCVAVDKKVMRNIVRWAREGAKIVITEKSGEQA